jgi:acylphosphatase
MITSQNSPENQISKDPRRRRTRQRGATIPLLPFCAVTALTKVKINTPFSVHRNPAQNRFRPRRKPRNPLSLAIKRPPFGPWQASLFRAILENYPQSHRRPMSGSRSEQVYERREIRFSGKVQGVGFRYTTRDIATRHRVAGFVQNLDDGRVLLVVEGERLDIDGFLNELRAESQRNIRGEESTTLPVTNEYIDFSIHH